MSKMKKIILASSYAFIGALAAIDSFSYFPRNCFELDNCPLLIPQNFWLGIVLYSIGTILLMKIIENNVKIEEGLKCDKKK